MNPGDCLNDRYVIEKTLKSGIFLARDLSLDNSLCAIKRMHSDGGQEEYLRGRFVGEMLPLMHLQHPGIPRVRDCFSSGSSLFLATDYIEGPTLEEEAEERRQRKKTVPCLSAVYDILEVLEVLVYLHGQPSAVLHRDIKPANLIRSQGRIKLVDFGLARSVESRDEPDSTLSYSAPEQLKGNPERRSDLYSVGATLHEMVSGERPTRAGVTPLKKANMPDYDPDLAAIIERACQAEADQRFASASEFQRTLAEWRDAKGRTVSVRPARPKRRFPVGGFVLLAVLVVGLCLGLRPHGPPPPTDPGLSGDIFARRPDSQFATLTLGEDVGLLRLRAGGGLSANDRATRVAARLNALYHQQCPQCGQYLLEPEGIRVGRYRSGTGDEVVVFYAHWHGKELALGPELLGTVDLPLARQLHTTPPNLAGYWRDLLRQVVLVSRGQTAPDLRPGAAIQDLLQRARAEQQEGTSLANLHQSLKRLPAQQALSLGKAFLKVPPGFRFEADHFPEVKGYRPLTP